MSVSATPKKRPKPKPKPNGGCSSDSVPSSSSSLKSILEPPQNFFPSKDDFLRLIAVLAIATSVTLACNFFATFLLNRESKPFCDTTVVDSLDSLYDFCEPCPSNGHCYEGKLECDHGYRKHGKLCIEDGEIIKTAKKLSEWIELHLCEANAQYLCDGTGKIWVPENDIWNDLDGHKLMEHVGSDNAVNIHIKRKTMEIIGKVLESRTNPHGFKEIKCPDVLAEQYKPFSCHLYQLISKNAILILPVCALLVGCTLLLWKVRQRQYLSTRVEELYRQVCEILEENALMSKRGEGECESWVVASRLRDHLLSPKERKNHALWKQVEELVQEDSRVDRYPKLVKGEPKVVWEWQVEGFLSPAKTRKNDDATKSKSSEGMKANSSQQNYRLKTEPGELIF